MVLNKKLWSNFNFMIGIICLILGSIGYMNFWDAQTIDELAKYAQLIVSCTSIMFGLIIIGGEKSGW